MVEKRRGRLKTGENLQYVRIFLRIIAALSGYLYHLSILKNL